MSMQGSRVDFVNTDLRKGELVRMYGELSKGFGDSFLGEVLVATGKGGKYVSRDYIAANAFLSELLKVELRGRLVDRSLLVHRGDAARYLHPNVMFRLNMYVPCLAYRFDELRQGERDRLFDEGSFWFTEKLRGVRGVLVSSYGRTSLFSRNYSSVGCEVPEYWGNVAQDFRSDFPFAVDVELQCEEDAGLLSRINAMGYVVNSTLEAMDALLLMRREESLSLQREFKERTGRDLVVFRLINVLYWGGVDYRKCTVGAAFQCESVVVSYAVSRGLNLRPIVKVTGSRSEKESFLESVLARGGEGVVVHNHDAVYCTEERRDRMCYVKIKRSVGVTSTRESMGDTVDGFVTGFHLGVAGSSSENLVCSLDVSAWIQDADNRRFRCIVAVVPVVDRALQRELTEVQPGGDVQLSSRYWGVIVEVSGQGVSRVNYRVIRPRLVRFRYDKLPDDCVLSQAFWESQVRVVVS